MIPPPKKKERDLLTSLSFIEYQHRTTIGRSALPLEAQPLFALERLVTVTVNKLMRPSDAQPHARPQV